MKIILEQNQRFGKGYQVRFVMGPINKVNDINPYTLSEGAQTIVGEVNKDQGTHIRLEDVLQVESSFINDVWSRADLKEETRGVEIDNESEIVLTASGVLLFDYFAWVDDDNQKAHDFILAYCKLLALKDYPGSAMQIMSDLEQMDKNQGADWLRSTYQQYIDDDMEIFNLFSAIGANVSRA